MRCQKTILLGAALFFAPLALYAQNRPSELPRLTDPVLKRCTVTVKDQLSIPATDAGVLVQMNVVVGDVVQKGDLLAKIDDTDASVQKVVAQNTLERASAEAKSEINVKYSEMTADAAQIVHDSAVKTNDRAKRSNSSPPYPAIEVHRLWLEWQRAKFQTDQAVMDRQLAATDEKARAAELDGATKAVERRKFLAPFAGQVVRVYRHEGEWVQPGDSILWVMNFKIMKVQASVDASEYNPVDLDGKPVTVDVPIARGRIVSLQGAVKTVTPVILGDNAYNVEAEVVNKVENGHWIVPHGALATMTIHVN